MVPNKITSPAQLSDCALLRLWQIIGDPGRNIPPLLPISRTTWLNGVKSGKYPAAIRLSKRSVAWRYADIKDLLEGLGGV